MISCGFNNTRLWHNDTLILKEYRVSAQFNRQRPFCVTKDGVRKIIVPGNGNFRRKKRGLIDLAYARQK